ncbi:hypothetical protein UJ101_00535 [Flavobacteriaceae bacterium UJ101]|nr:hypothetical protein UJ101_00535 [Flavobacteriaceae bacterium UJ101]
MKITIIGVNYFPEDTATGLYTTQMAEYLARNHEVSIITGFPYYPVWKISDDYSNQSTFLYEEVNDVKIYRYKQYVPKNPTFFKRIVHLIDFTIGSIRNLFKIKESDVIISIVPFTSSVFLGYILKKRLNAKLWTHIQDFEFDAAVESGLTSKSFFNNLFFEYLFKIENILLNRSDVNSTISFGMLSKLKLKSNSTSYYLPNWVDPDFINPKNSNTHKYMLSDKFKILYSGNIGAKQDWGFFIKFLDYNINNDSIEIIVVGDGAKKDWLLNKIKDYNNVIYYPPVPFEELPDLLCSADIHILFQKQNVIDTVMPSKLLGMMASGKPSIVLGNNKSEVKKVLDESKGGVYLSTRNEIELSMILLKLIKDKSLIIDLGNNARNYISEKFAYKEVLHKFDNRLELLIGEKN